MARDSIVRQIDTLGRVVLPIQVRKLLGITEKNEIEIFIERESIVMTPYSSVYLFSGFPGELIDVNKGKLVSGHHLCLS
ncbi:AbrB/MazE/SpoVT family DNA-binding domain-containing protein [Alicyclobacillus sp. SO9]|nr:AbrB/MazE/SpoVT family DNA-binding domain-containing protein [Alicyclobacillus sp. SO9]